MWQRNNFEWYYEKGASPLSDTCMYRLERNLLNNFVETADTVIASGKPAATLRYGHDTNLAPLAALMGMDSLTVATKDWQQIADTYRTYRIIPMCGNIQLVGETSLERTRGDVADTYRCSSLLPLERLAGVLEKCGGRNSVTATDGRIG